MERMPFVRDPSCRHPDPAEVVIGLGGAHLPVRRLGQRICQTCQSAASPPTTKASSLPSWLVPMLNRHEGWNEKPKPKPDVGIVWLDAALNPGGPLAGHIEAFALGDDGALWHAWQIDVKPNWSPWHSLGAPAPKIRASAKYHCSASEPAFLP
jgi:hypothetical protein